MKQTIFVVFFIVIGCFLTLFALTSKRVVTIQMNQSISLMGVCSVQVGRRVSIHCQPDITTADCSHLPNQKCPIKKLRKLLKLRIYEPHIQQAKILLKSPQNCLISVSFTPRGSAKIKRIQVGDYIFESQ